MLYATNKVINFFVHLLLNKIIYCIYYVKTIFCDYKLLRKVYFTIIIVLIHLYLKIAVSRFWKKVVSEHWV